MIIYKNKNGIIIPSHENIEENENSNCWFYEQKINLLYLKIILGLLTKKEFDIFLTSMCYLLNNPHGYPVYYGYSYAYDKKKCRASYYKEDDLIEMICTKCDYKAEAVKKTFNKLIKYNVIIPKMSYVTINNDVDRVLFINDYVVTYENTGMGVAYLDDLKYDDEGIVDIESYCELPYEYYHPNSGRKICKSQIDRNSTQSKEWTLKIKERAKYTCQCCGSTVISGMAAHHILNWSSNEDLRYEMSNGICLCNNCHNPYMHGSFHNTYGTRNNTKEQLQEYINNKRKILGLNPVNIDEIIKE